MADNVSWPVFLSDREAALCEPLPLYCFVRIYCKHPHLQSNSSRVTKSKQV